MEYRALNSCNFFPKYKHQTRASVHRLLQQNAGYSIASASCVERIGGDVFCNRKEPRAAMATQATPSTYRSLIMRFVREHPADRSR